MKGSKKVYLAILLCLLVWSIYIMFSYDIKPLEEGAIPSLMQTVWFFCTCYTILSGFILVVFILVFLNHQIFESDSEFNQFLDKHF